MQCHTMICLVDLCLGQRVILGSAPQTVVVSALKATVLRVLQSSVSVCRL